MSANNFPQQEPAHSFEEPTNPFDQPSDPTNDPFYVGDDYGIENPLLGEAIKLPFFAPYVWWYNGRGVNRNIGGVPFYGGWGIDIQDALTLSENIGMKAGQLLPGWTQYQLPKDEEDIFDAAMCRNVHVSILGTRFRWLQGDDDKSWRSHVQALAYMSLWYEKKFYPVGPVVLTIKGYASSALKKALLDFDTKTLAARKRETTSELKRQPLGISAFWANVGTFAPEPVWREVGKGVKKKKITEPFLNLPAPEEIDRAFLMHHFVGTEIAQETNRLRKLASEWLDAWKREDVERNDASNVDDEYPAH